MMQSQLNNRVEPVALRQVIMLLLGLVMVLLFTYLLALTIQTTVLLMLMISVPMLLVGQWLLRRISQEVYLTMGVGMFALGGIGMLLGCTVDLGPLGLYGLLSLCQTLPLSLNLNGLGLYWQKIQLSPWTYLGMVLGGNLGMLLFRRDSISRALPGFLPVVLVCNLGMLGGMLIGDLLIVSLVDIDWQILAVGLMVLVMLSSMTLGMLAALWCLDRLFFLRPGVQR